MEPAVDLQRAVAALGLGVCGALLLAWALRLAGGGAPPPGPPRVWLCDRDAGRLWALDEDGFLAGEQRLAFPLALASARDGERVVLHALGPGPAAPRRLLRLGPRGESRGELRLAGAGGPRVDVARGDGDSLRGVGDSPRGAGGVLAVDAGGTAFALAGPVERPRLVAWSRTGERRALELPAGAARLRLGVDHLWVLGEAGAWALPLRDDRDAPEDRPAREPHLAWPGERPLDATFDGRGSWWLTATARGTRLRRLDGRGVPAPEAEVPARHELEGPPRAACLVGDGRGGAWCLSADGTWRRLAADGRLGPARDGLLRPLRDACPDAAGGFWVVSPGAAQRVDRSGRLRFAQGGYDVLVGVGAAVPTVAR